MSCSESRKVSSTRSQRRFCRQRHSIIARAEALPQRAFTRRPMPPAPVPSTRARRRPHWPTPTGSCSLIPGLFFIGEVVDVTGWLGGYNFQWAWASAAACARTLTALEPGASGGV